MKTPEEIKWGLDYCRSVYGLRMNCHSCPYDGEMLCGAVMLEDALAYIQQLESELEAVKRERDAAVRELPHNCWNCMYHLDKPIEETDDCGRTIHIYCSADYCFPDENSSWEWRGVCQENTEVQDED